MIDISIELEERLNEAANRRGVSLEKLLNDLLGEKQSSIDADAAAHAPELPVNEGGNTLAELADTREEKYPPGSLARFAKVAIKSGMASKEKVDTSARSREILNNEFANYIDRRNRR